jgi:hypothetical protein
VTVVDQLLMAWIFRQAELLRCVRVPLRVERTRRFPDSAQHLLQFPGQRRAFTRATPEEPKSVDLVASEIAHLQFHHCHLTEEHGCPRIQRRQRMVCAIALDPLGSSDLAFVSCFHVILPFYVANDPAEAR